MQDVLDVIKNIESIYDSQTAFSVLKDFERVLDELDIYVYKNWKNGELCQGPQIDRHKVTCVFMWPRNEMPDPMGGKRLTDYDCKLTYAKSHLVVPRKIQEPDDIRPGTKKGKLDRKPIWCVSITMPKSLIGDIYTGYRDREVMDPLNLAKSEPAPMQPADQLADETTNELEAET